MGNQKSSSSYPLFSIRIGEAEKELINELVENVRFEAIKNFGKPWLKNQVVVKALRLGLPLLAKQLAKRGTDSEVIRRDGRKNSVDHRA